MIECVSAFTSVTVFYDLLAVRNMASPLSESQSAYEIVSDLVRERAAGMATEASGQARTVEIPVCYGGSFGPDLAYVAEHNKLTPSEVIDIHTSGEYLVYMIGFALISFSAACRSESLPRGARLPVCQFPQDR